MCRSVPQTEVRLTRINTSLMPICGYGREMYETWYQMSVMLQCGLNIRPVITHRLPYGDFEEAFHIMRDGNAGKIILDWEKI